MSDLLRSKLAGVRRKSVVVLLATTACAAIAVLMFSTALEMIADFEIELPFTVRCAWLAITLAMILSLIVRDMVFPLLRMPDDDEVALWVEHESPGLRSRLIAAIQLTRAQAVPAGQSVALVHALVRQTEDIAEPMDFLAVIKVDRLARWAGVAALLILLGLGGMAWGRPSSSALLQRALLVPGVDVPRKTRVQLITANPFVVAIGDNVELRVQAKGEIPASGSLNVRYDGEGQPVTLHLLADPAHPGQFALPLDAVSRSFTWRAMLNDGHSIDAHVIAAARPAILSMQIAEVFPAYTHLAPERLPADDLHILAGSRLVVRARSNKPLRTTRDDQPPFNRVVFQCKSNSVSVPMTVEGTVDGANSQSLMAEVGGNPDIPVPADAQGLSIYLVDQDGLQSKDPAVYPIQIVPDQPPALRITYPDRKEQLSTASAQLLIGVDVSDDFALGKLSFRYRVLPPSAAEAMAAENGAAPDTAPLQLTPSTDAAPANSIDLNLKGTPKDFRGHFNIDLSQLQPTPLVHGQVEWWLEAEDTNDVTGPGKTASDHYLSRIATEAEVRSDLFARLGNNMGELKEAAENQKQDNADLGQLIQQKAASPAPQGSPSAP